MGCGKSKTVVITQSTSSVQDPEYFETPVEDIRGTYTQAISSDQLNDEGTVQQNSNAGVPTANVDAVPDEIEHTPVEEFKNDESNSVRTASREKPVPQTEAEVIANQAKAKNIVRPSSAISSIDSVAVQAFVNNAISKAAADPRVGGQLTNDVRPQSAVSSVDSVAVRALVDHVITKAADNLKDVPEKAVAETDEEAAFNYEGDTVRSEASADSGLGSRPEQEKPPHYSNDLVIPATDAAVPNETQQSDGDRPQSVHSSSASSITEPAEGTAQKDEDGVVLPPIVPDTTPSQSQDDSVSCIPDPLPPIVVPPSESSPSQDAEEEARGSAPESAQENDINNAEDDAPENITSAPDSSPSTCDIPPEDPKAQEMFDRALQSFCPLVDPKELLDLVTPGLRNLHLDHAAMAADATFTQLLAKLNAVQELSLAKHEMGPESFRVIMLAMAANKSIKTLNMSNNKTDTDSAESVGVMLTGNRTLERLDLSSNQLGKDYLSRCIGPPLSANTSLTSLNISSCGATDLSALMEGLQQNSCLTSLDVSHNQMSNSSTFVDILGLIIKNTSCAIKELNIRNCGLQGSGFEVLGDALRENISLVTLHAGSNEATSLHAFSQFVMVCLQHPSLETLNLNDTRRASPDQEEIPALTPPSEIKDSKLAVLHLANCGLNDAVVMAIATTLPASLPCLRELSLSGNVEMSTASLDAVSLLLAKDAGPTLLTHLVLDQLQLEDLPNNLAQSVSSFPNLTNLSVCKAKMSPASVGKLNELVTGPTGIKDLCLSGLKLSETEALAQLLSPGKNLSLTCLSLAGCALKDSDLSPLTLALKGGWQLTSLTLANNRFTGTGVNELLEALLWAGQPLALETLNLNNNQISDEHPDAFASLLSQAPKLQSLSLNKNSLGCQTLTAIGQCLHLAESLRVLDLRDQQANMDEDDLEDLMKKLAEELGYKVEQDDYGSVKIGSSPLPSRVSGEPSVFLTGLGPLVGPVGQALDSAVVKTDYGILRHPHLLGLQHALHLGAWLTQQDLTSQPELSSASWEAIIGIKKDTSVPSWLKVASLRDNAVYITNLPSNVSPSKLEGDLDAEADCSVKEVCIMRDPVQRKPTGIAWVLMADQESVRKAMDFYHSGQSLMFSQPYIISPVSLKLPDLDESEQTAENVSAEMARREQERAAEAAEHQALLATSFAASKARHEYAKAHPAYADGRIF